MSAYKPKGKLGTGSRFRALKEKISKEKGYSNEEAAATAANIGRKKYTKARFQKMAAKGK